MKSKLVLGPEIILDDKMINKLSFYRPKFHLRFNPAIFVCPNAVGDTHETKSERSTLYK